MESIQQIPEVPMNPLLHPSLHSRASYVAASEKLVAALETFGVAYLSFTGESGEEYDAALTPAYKEASQFFSHSLEYKTAASAPPGTLPPGVTRGYLATGSESGSSQFEFKEAFSWSKEATNNSGNEQEQHVLSAANIWPEESGALRKSFSTLFDFLHQVMRIVAGGLQTGGALPEGVLTDALRQIVDDGVDISLLRAFRYHATEDDSLATGSSEHTDWGFATLVAQENGSIPALQVLSPDKKSWQTVIPRPRTLILNGSDFLCLLSRGKIRSPLHRVTLTKRSRTSFVYFQYPPANATVPTNGENQECLSLLCDQRPGSKPGTKLSLIPGDTFGDLIARKWAHVSRA